MEWGEEVEDLALFEELAYQWMHNSLLAQSLFSRLRALENAAGTSPKIPIV
jgi:hypothetical protein